MNIKSAYITFTGQYILLLFLLQTLPFAQTTIEFQNFTAKGSDTVFAASTKGIYISADQGVTFKKFALDSLDITSLIILNDAELLASSYSNYGVLRSSDYGMSWHLSGLQNQYAINQLLMIPGGILIAASHEEHIWRSTDRGFTWSKSNTLNVANRVHKLFYYSEGNSIVAGHAGGVSYSADTARNWLFYPGSEGYTFTVAGWGEYFFAGRQSNLGLIRSTDAGVSWHNLTNGLPVATFMSLLAEEGLILAGTFGKGVYRSIDSGNTFQNTLLSTERVYALSRHYSGKLFAGTNTGIHYSSDNGINWTKATLLTNLEYSPENMNFSLEQNFPNPFNPATVVSFSISKQAPVSIAVFTPQGEKIFEINSGVKEPGQYRIPVTLEGFPSGMYIYQIIAGEFSAQRKMMLLK
ncbi:MAG: hypothetical protein FMNOHCHN_00560 [Ignavibacteriaceae bacterium]|nr:hypothetical protein [Ignavibacteriaceae bacterium]